MKKVYFDINIYSNLQNNKEYYDIVLNSKNNSFKYYYSYYHIVDLETSQCRIDNLSFMENIVDDNYIDYLDEKIKYFNKKPTIFINHNTNFTENYNKKLKTEEFKNDILNKYNINNALLEYHINKREKIVRDKTEHKEYRRELKFRMNKMSDKQLDELITCSLRNGYDKYYIILFIYKDILDINENDSLKDTLSNEFKNITMDSWHCCLGASCDYIVTEDKRLKTKSEYIYKKLNINTKVYTLDKFIEEIKNNLN